MAADDVIKQALNTPEKRIGAGVVGIVVGVALYHRLKDGSFIPATPSTSGATMSGATTTAAAAPTDSGLVIGGTLDSGTFGAGNPSAPSVPTAPPPVVTNQPTQPASPVPPASTAPAAPAATPAAAPVFQVVAPWPAWNSTLWGIATHYGLTLSQLLALPYNAQYRANPSLVYAGNQVQVG